MNRWMTGALAVAVVALSACGPKELPVLTCAGELTGPIEGTFARCSGFDQLYRQNTDTFSMSVAYNELAAGLTYELSASVEMRGEPEPGRQQQTSCLATLKSGKKKYLASVGMGAVSGSCQVNFSDVVGYPQQGNTISYCVLKGRITARLDEDPLDATSVPVNLRLDFDYAPAATDPESVNRICGVTTP